MNAQATTQIRPGGSLRRTGTAHTFRLQALMELEKKAQIGERIRELREASPHTNRSIADELGVSERAVAKWIAGGGIAWDNVVSVAKLFHVEPEFIWSGREEGQGETPDLLGTLSGPGVPTDLDERLEWIEGALQLLLAERGLEHDAPGSERDPQRQGGSSGGAPRR